MFSAMAHIDKRKKMCVQKRFFFPSATQEGEIFERSRQKRDHLDKRFQQKIRGREIAMEVDAFQAGGEEESKIIEGDVDSTDVPA